MEEQQDARPTGTGFGRWWMIAAMAAPCAAMALVPVAAAGIGAPAILIVAALAVAVAACLFGHRLFMK